MPKNANVVHRVNERGDYEYDVRWFAPHNTENLFTEGNHDAALAALTFECLDIEAASKLAAALNEHALKVTVHGE